MHEKIRKITIKEINRHESAVSQLDEYIRLHDKRYEKIKLKQTNTAHLGKLCQSLEQLKESIRRDKRHRIEAYEYLKDSNKTMKRTIEELRESFKTCRDSMRNEFKKINSASTERLLNIDPNSLYCNLRK